MEDVIFMCPHCKGDISHMSHEDSVREDTNKMFGPVLIYMCPYCEREFDDIQIEVKKIDI